MNWSDKLKSRKLWMAVAGVVIAVLGYLRGDLNADQAVQALQVIVAGYVVGQGVADAGVGVGAKS